MKSKIISILRRASGHRCTFDSKLGAQAGCAGLLRCHCGKIWLYLVPGK
jgi:hypothetical protein